MSQYGEFVQDPEQPLLDIWPAVKADIEELTSKLATKKKEFLAVRGEHSFSEAMLTSLLELEQASCVKVESWLQHIGKEEFKKVLDAAKKNHNQGELTQIITIASTSPVEMVKLIEFAKST